RYFSLSYPIPSKGGKIMLIDLFDQTETLTEEQIQLLKNVLVFTAKKEKIAKEVELSVSIVTDEEIKKFNYQYRNKNEPTDVLSFQMDNPFIETKDDDNHSIPLLLGDIMILIDKVKEQ